MTLIDYEAYLDGDEWPSESARPVIGSQGEYQPEMKPVYDMPPQYASAALHKLVRWARDGALDMEGEAEQERRVRLSTLGRLLARKALGIEDFELYEEHGVHREVLGNEQVARVLARELLMVAVDLTPTQIGQLATDLALALNNEGYLIYRSDE